MPKEKANVQAFIELVGPLEDPPALKEAVNLALKRLSNFFIVSAQVSKAEEGYFAAILYKDIK